MSRIKGSLKIFGHFLMQLQLKQFGYREVSLCTLLSSVHMIKRRSRYGNVTSMLKEIFFI